MMKRNQFFNKASIYLILGILPFLIYSCKKKDHVDQKDIPSTVAEDWSMGDVFFDENHWTECVVGDMPLVISVPHGGSVDPNSIPDRSCPDIVTVTDGSTIELAREIKDALESSYHVSPYLVICHLKRTKIDQNRDLAESACGNSSMVAPWNQFHDYVDTALANAVHKFGSAIYIDLHAHGHENQRLEIGYALSANELNSVFYENGDLEDLWHKSSLNNSKRIKNIGDFRKFIIGEVSFGTLMGVEGFKAVPSEDDPYPKSGEKYFNGGYNSRRYTSEDYPKVYGWQIESNYDGVRNPAGRPVFAGAFAKVILEYLQETMQYKP